MFRRRHRAFRRAAWLALLALFLQTVVPVLHHPASAALPAGVDAANLCMAPGSQAPPPSDTDKSLIHGTQSCAICQTLQMLGGGFVAPDAATLAPAFVVERISVFSPDAAVLGGRAVTQNRARAPPLKA